MRAVLIGEGGDRAQMRQLDGADFYRWGASIRPLISISKNTVLDEIYRSLMGTLSILSEIKSSDVKLTFIEKHLTDFEYALVGEKVRVEDGVSAGHIPLHTIETIRYAAQHFETILTANLSQTDTYHVQPKAGYDTKKLISDGLSIFPDLISKLVPEACDDIIQATRCLAFDLYTASAYHIHRANEAVCKKYYDYVCEGNQPRQERPTMGQYLHVLSENNLGDEMVVASLKDIVRLHRNPIAHPEHSIRSFAEANALFGAINSAMYQMLSRLPDSADASS